MPPLPAVEHPEFTIEAIVQERAHNSGLQYRVHWKDYTAAYDTWEHVASLEAAVDLIRSFRARVRPASDEVALLRLTSPL